MEDKLTCESDVIIDGTLYANGVKLGTTTITESDFQKSITGVNGIISDASLAPSASKKVKLTLLKDGSGNVVGMDEMFDMTKQSEYVQAKGVVTQDQVYSHTGFVTSETKKRDITRSRLF